MAMRIKPKPNCRPSEVLGYFSRLNRWRRRNGLKAYTSIQRLYQHGSVTVVFGHRSRPILGRPKR